jgi:hypothetical protein
VPGMSVIETKSGPKSVNGSLASESGPASRWSALPSRATNGPWAQTPGRAAIPAAHTRPEG